MSYETYDDAYETDSREYEQWEASYRLLKNLAAKLGDDAPLSMALGMAKLFEPLRPGSPRWQEEQARIEASLKK